MTPIQYAIAKVNKQRARKGLGPVPNTIEKPALPLNADAPAPSTEATRPSKSRASVNSYDMHLSDKRAKRTVPPLYDAVEPKPKSERKPWGGAAMSKDEENRLRAVLAADRLIETRNFLNSAQYEAQLVQEAEDEARRRRIARCEEEIQRLEALPANIKDRAYLVTMGIEDWRAEKLLEEFGASEAPQ